MARPSDGETFAKPSAVGAPSLAPNGRGLDIICRAYYAFVGVNALGVAILGILFPKSLARTFTWLVLPPLHARFIGVLYLFGAVYLFCCTIARRASQTDPALVTVFIFTTILGVLTFLNLKAFDYGRAPSWVWTAAYVLFPLSSLGLTGLLRRDPPRTAAPGPSLFRWARSFLLLQAGAFAVVGVLLLVARSAMVDAWPWKVTKVLAQSYACAFLAFAWCSLRYAFRDRVSDVAIFLPAMLVLTGGTLAASLKYHVLFSASRTSTWVWFGGFGVLFVGLVGIGIASITARAGVRERDSYPVVQP